MTIPTGRCGLRPSTSIRKGVFAVIKEYDKVRLKTGEIARISEVLEDGVAYIAEIIRRNGDFSVSIEQIKQTDISSVFVETEKPITA